MRAILKTLMALVLAFAAPGASADGDIHIRDPWVQAAPPNVKIMAAYLEIHNSGKAPRILASVSSPVFEQVGIHRSVMHGNMVHMEHLNELAVPPQASAVLKPGGLHLMLTDAKKQLHIGDQVPITLLFKGGGKIQFMAAVRSGRAAGVEDHRHMDHSGHGTHKP